MAAGPRTRVPFRRRREGRTDYRARLALLKSGKPRLVVRRTNGDVIVQFVEWAESGDRVRATAHARELAKMGWNNSAKNTPAAYLTGLLAGQRAAQAGIGEAVLDMGRRTPVPGGRVFAVLKGVLDAGVEVPHGEGVFPEEERLTGAFLDQKKDFTAVRAKIAPAAKSKATTTDEEE